MTWPHLPKAPIEEALIDLRVELGPGRTFADLAPLVEAWKIEYPEGQERVAWHGQLSIGRGERQALATTSSAPVGHLLRSRDGLQVVQARLDGFTFSRLRPYESWSDLRGEAERLWSRYVEIAEPLRVTRLAVRFINRLRLPVPVELADYVRTCPTIAAGLPQQVSGVFMRVVLPFPSEAASCVVTQALEGSDTEAQEAAYIFDIDAFRATIERPEDEHVWEVLESLRDVKNQVFFHTVTDKALEMFR